MRNRCLNLVGIILSVCFIFSLEGCQNNIKIVKKTCEEEKNMSWYIVKSTEMRMINPEEYFSKEQEMIKKRRTGRNNESKGVAEIKEGDDIIGLAFSGGGIRSTAFQLGLLSGLHEIGFLQRVDYISAVSGGSWAMAAYKMSELKDDEFFNNLNRVVLQDNLETNDERIRPLFNSYGETIKKMMNHKFDFANLHIGDSSQENWRRMLLLNVLNNRDVLLKDLNEDPAKSAKRSVRPYIIFNATHSAEFDDGITIKERFPFEITADFIGTLADCVYDSKYYCKREDSKFIFEKQKDIEAYQKIYGFFISTECTDLPPLYVSHAMAISGAVLPPEVNGIKLNLFDWHLVLPKIYKVKGNDTCNRKDIILSDGGHSENLGALPLIERKVPMIIISDASHYSDDISYGLQVLKYHAESLFTDLNIKEVPSKEEIDKEEKKKELRILEYFQKDKDGKKKIGTILYIKPSSYTSGPDDFPHYLIKDKIKAHKIRAYLDTLKEHAHAKFQFPNDKTFATSYDNTLIYAYYLLGRYFATEKLQTELKKRFP